MKDVEIIGMLKSYVQKSLVGVGALKGAPCKIQSITDGDGFHTVKFEWTDDAGTSHTSDMIVNDGSDIASITQDGATITVKLSDGTSHDFIVPTVQGPKGDKGDKGDTGAGVPEGGTAGQVLVKKSSTDYDTKWDTPVGGGDMLKSVYDTDNDGKVDSAENADTVDGHTVAKDVPADAKFTDTVYDDTEIRAEIPSKTSDLTNDSGFITKAVNDLVNYYLKSETYSKTEVDDIVTAIKNSRFEVVATLPTTDIKTNVIYLVPKDPAQTSNVKNEYINLDGTTSGWEKIGDTEIDLSGYVTTQALNTALEAYTTTADLTTLLAEKQDTLTFDNVPTENSNNPVKSGGVYSADDKIYQVMGQNSAKNFIPFDLDRIKAKNTTGTWSGNVYSVNGIDFTFNSDGTVDASGTATETASVHYYDPVGLPPFGGDRILRLTGCPSGGGSGTTYKVMAYRVGEVDGSTGTAEDYGDGISLKWLNNGSGIKAFISISVYTGAGTIDLTFKPMLRLSTDTDNTFAPYAKTNQQLTAENQTLTNYDANTGVKNLFDNTATNETSDGVTFTVSTDKRVSVVGTLTTDYVVKVLGTFHGEAGKQYLVTGGISSTKFVDVYNTSAGIDVKDTGNGVTFTPQSDTDFNFAIVISGNGSTFNDTFSPMIRPASITDTTYQPYAKTNQQLTKDTTALLDNLEINGAVNMLPNTATTQTINGVTFTVNSDGTVTANGTATANAVLKISDRFTLADYIGRKYVDAKKNEASSSTYSLIITYRNGSGAYVNETYVPTEGFILSTISNATLVEFGIFVKSGQSVSNLTFKPMITVASYNGDYVPYAKSNRELTEKIDIVGNLFTTTTKVVDNITHGIATTVATLENLPIGTYVVSGQFNSDGAMSGGGLIQFASSGVIQNGASCNPIINQGFKANAGLTGIFNVTNATNQINLQIYTATADLTVSSARLAAIRIA